MFDIQVSVVSLLIGLSLATALAGAAWRLGMLTADGWVTALLIGGLTYGLGGLSAAILLITFFASSSLLSKGFVSRKKQVSANFAKGGRRDWAQVGANGGFAVISLVAAAIGWVSSPVAWVAFSAALATVTADTWATEVGTLSANPPILITSGKKVPPGTSGGISLLGSGIALLGAMVIGLAAWLLGLISLVIFPLIVSAGLLGSFIDSLLGATVQAIYYCPQCKKETERHPLHYCGTPTSFHHGWRWLDNDWVNFLSSAFSALLAASLFAILV
jgi:uncharacterized protein (TIGR00297 family)